MGMTLVDQFTAFSGAFSPVPFIWLVVSYFQQAMELRLNTRALNLQALELASQSAEFARSVKEQQLANEHQAELVRVAKSQAEAERDWYKAQHDSERARASPRLMPGQTAGSSDLATSYPRLSVRNIGATASAVRLVPDPELDAKPVSVNLLQTGEDLMVQVTHPVAVPPGGKGIDVLYTDVFGERWVHHFMIKADLNYNQIHYDLTLADLGKEYVPPEPITQRVSPPSVLPPNYLPAGSEAPTKAP